MAAHSVANDGSGSLEGVQLVQQHTVFVEIIIDGDDGDGDQDEQIHEFGAVAGYAEECMTEGGGAGELFDNAVLWFNDQFLFGNKSNTDGSDAVRQCWIPSLWAIGIGSSQIHQTIDEATGEDTGDALDDAVGPELVKQLIDLDNDVNCNGCIFEYEATFYTTDPNGNSWMVDKLVYPISLAGDLFNSGSGEDCYDGSGMTTFDDPRSPGVHADECEDRSDNKMGTDPGEDNHRYNDNDQSDSGASLVEPLYITHLQVDPAVGNFGDDGRAPVAAALGDDTLAQYSAHYASENNDGNYSFVLAVDFLAFEGQILGSGNYTSQGEHHENATYSAGDTLAGDAHGEQGTGDAYGPAHDHSTVNLDIFLHDQAPYFVETNNVWDEDPDNAGQSPEVNDRCDDTADPNDTRSPHIQNRAVMVCDTTADRAFHAHDGSQTTFPS